MARFQRRGFSLIELLIVMAVILILMAIGVLAYQHIEKVAGEKSTMTRLEMCSSMLHEYDLAASLAAIEGPGGLYPTTGLPRALFFKASNVTYSTPLDLRPYGRYNVMEGSPQRVGAVMIGIASAGPPWQPLPNPDMTDPSQAYAPPYMRYPAPVQYTGMAFQIFSQIPNVKLMLDQLPGNALLTVPPKTGSASTANGPYLDLTQNATSALTPKPLPVVLDGWNNPIIYVPSGGLAGVWIGGPYPNSQITTNAVIRRVVSVDGRPFWASAGADGDFSTGDDNIYSCPVRYMTNMNPPP